MARGRLACAGAAAALFAAACSGPDDLSIKLGLARDGCPVLECGAYGRLPCNAQLGAWIVDLDDPDRPPRQRCETGDTPPLPSLCGLRFGAATPFIDLEPGPVRIEVAVWIPPISQNETPPEDAGPRNQCPPQLTFDGQGKPVSPNPRLAFGGATNFELGTSSEVTVPLWCSMGPDELRQTPCVRSRSVAVQVYDLGTASHVSQVDAALFDVKAVKLSDEGLVPPEDVVDLEFVPNVEPAGEFREPSSSEQEFAEEKASWSLGGFLCAIVDDQSPQQTKTIACQEVAAGSIQVDLVGIRVASDWLNAVIRQMDPPDFPEAGLVIGRVVGPDGAPLEGVAVSVTDNQNVDVQYLDQNGNLWNGKATSRNGYFLSRNAPFNSTWKATRSGWTQRNIPAAGSISRKVSPLIIRMQEMPAAPPP